jgi:hypothetical protein
LLLLHKLTILQAEMSIGLAKNLNQVEHGTIWQVTVLLRLKSMEACRTTTEEVGVNNKTTMVDGVFNQTTTAATADGEISQVTMEDGALSRTTMAADLVINKVAAMRDGAQTIIRATMDGAIRTITDGEKE